MNKKGIDFSKAIIINDIKKYTQVSQKNIPQYQHNLIKKDAAIISRRFEKYVDEYCKRVSNNDVNFIKRVGRYSSLQNYHVELGIE